MLKLIEKYSINGLTVELFQTQHTGPDYHVRYGLEVTHYKTLKRARWGFDLSITHARDCETEIS